MGNTYKKVEIVGTSKDSVSEAVKSGIERAGKTLENLDWFEVKEIRGRIENGAVEEYQVSLQVGFRLK